MYMKKLGAAAAAAVAALIAGCGSGRAPETVKPPVMAHGVAVREPAADPRPYGAADTSFGLEALGAWCRADPGANLVLSPSSLASALGMAYLGARGDTARAMANVLHLPAAGGQALEAGLQARAAALRGLNGPGVTLAASDQVWADPALKTLPGYLNAVATGYDAGVAQVPLLSNPGQAAKQINQAISSVTRGQIQRLLSADSLRAHGIGWVLTDALYLHAAWDTPFDASLTAPGPFTTADGQHVTVKFMNGGLYQTASGAGWTAVRLPYRGGKLQMVALLPPAGDRGCAMPAAATLGTITARLAAGDASGNRNGGALRGVEFPRVSLGVHASLKSLLSQLGMGIAFSGTADFSGLSPQAYCIGLVEQAATLQVGEKGTVASAASAVGIEPTAGRATLPEVAFDRPYLMLVTATGTGEPLFIARVANAAGQ
jgi:serine protease inhibitor